ncbi:MAG: hypothetical protein U5M23_13835 [Marinagarivorans sp.]|nr:hypothetical protein [Marinagarivorans sp.]
MQDLQRYITNIRNHYLNIYMDAIKTFKAQHEQTEVEALGSMNGIEDRPEIFRWRRFDLVTHATQPPRMANFRPDTHVNFEPQSYVWQRKMKVRLEPIAWNDVSFECTDFNLQKSQLEHWAVRWMDPNNQRPVDNHGMGNRIHAVTFPERKVNRTEFFVDFGSAPIQAFQELLQVLMLAGTKKVRIRTHSLRASEAQQAEHQQA